MISPAFALLASLWLAAPDASARVGVLCAGPGCGGALQFEVEAQIALVPGRSLVPGSRIASSVTDAPVMGAGAMDAAAQATELLARAEAEFFDGDLTAAEKTLQQVNDLQIRGGEATTDRPRYFLLRGAVKVKKGDVPGGEAALRSALQLDPDLTADRFPPSLNEALERARNSLPPRVLLKIVVTPPDAEVRVDGRIAPGVLTVVPGKHQLVARSPGHRTVQRIVTIAGETRLRLALAVSLPTALEAATATWVFAGASDQPPAGLADMASRAGLDRVVVLATRPLAGGGHEARAAVFSAAFATAKAGPGGIMLTADGDAPGIAKWVADALREAPAATKSVPVAATKPPRAAGSRSLTRRPVFWGGVGAVALAVIAGGAVAASSSKGSTRTDDQQTTLTVGFE